MHKNAILVAAVAACLSSGMAMAQSGDHRGERGDRYQQQTQRQDNDRGDQNRYEQAQRGDQNRYEQRGNDNRGYSRDNERRDYRADRGDYREHREHRDFRRYDGYNGRGAGPRYDMRRGGYVSQEYRGSRYVVSDWRRHRGLYAPQRGYQWVQAGNDYLLVAVATGLIAQVLLN